MPEDVTHADIAARMDRLEEKVDKLTDLIDALSAIKTGGKVINWLAKALAAGIGLYIAAEAGAQWLVKLGTK